MFYSLDVSYTHLYDDVNKNESAIPYIGNYDILLNDAKAGKIAVSYTHLKEGTKFRESIKKLLA